MDPLRNWLPLEIAKYDSYRQVRYLSPYLTLQDVLHLLQLEYLDTSWSVQVADGAVLLINTYLEWTWPEALRKMGAQPVTQLPNPVTYRVWLTQST